jgi:citrate lyase beta subunit
VIAAAAQANGQAVRLDGKLIDLPVVERARRLLQAVVPE